MYLLCRQEEGIALFDAKYVRYYTKLYVLHVTPLLHATPPAVA